MRIGIGIKRKQTDDLDPKGKWKYLWEGQKTSLSRRNPKGPAKQVKTHNGACRNRWNLLNGACAKCKKNKIRNNRYNPRRMGTSGMWSGWLGSHPANFHTLVQQKNEEYQQGSSVEGPAMLMAAMGRVTTSLGIPKRSFRRPGACQTGGNPKAEEH